MAVQVILIEPSRTSQSTSRIIALNGQEHAERKCSSETSPTFLQVYSTVRYPIATEDMVLIPIHPIKLNIVATVKERLKSGYELSPK